jgi:hypothetical protein
MPLDPKQFAAIREATTEPTLRAARDLLIAEVERLKTERDEALELLRAAVWSDAPHLKAAVDKTLEALGHADDDNKHLRAQVEALTPCPHVGVDRPLVTKCAFCAAKGGRSRDLDG